METKGQLDPLLITLDHVIVGGHRRYAAAVQLGWTTIKVLYDTIYSTDPDFERRVVSHNKQRDKTPAVRIREQIVLVNPEDAYAAVQSQRAEAARVKVAPFVLDTSRRKRSKIGRLTRPFLNAVVEIVNELEDEWPIGERAVHYKTSSLAEPPLTNINRPGSIYLNDLPSSKKLSMLMTKARLEGYIPFEAICDETRPVESWATHGNVSSFMAQQTKSFGTNYWRDLQQGQPNHIEIVGEKLTIQTAIRAVSSHYCIPYSIGRGYSSLPPRRDMFERFKASGGKNLIILFVCDHDPEGQNIPQSFAHSMKDDFGVRQVHPIRVGLNPDQVRGLRLPASIEAKKTSSRFRRFERMYGDHAYEIDAVPTDTLKTWLRDAINSVIDVAAFNAQVEMEKKEQQELEGLKRFFLEQAKAYQGAFSSPGGDSR
jgi:hypothetical protein